MRRRPEIRRAARQACLASAAEGKIKPLVGEVWSFDEAPGALEAVTRGQIIGKALVALPNQLSGASRPLTPTPG